MKKITLISVLVLGAILLCACGNNGKKQPDSTTTEPTTSEITQETTDATTTAESKIETTITTITTISTTVPETTTASTAKLNLDLLADIGRSYSQLLAKRGELIGAEISGGSIEYYFKNGYGAYCWGLEELDWGQEVSGSWPLPWDDNDNLILADLQKPAANCGSIWYVKPSELFLGLERSITSAEIEKSYGLKHIGTESLEDFTIYGNEKYISTFSYNGKEILIYTKEKDKVDLGSCINID